MMRQMEQRVRELEQEKWQKRSSSPTNADAHTSSPDSSNATPTPQYEFTPGTTNDAVTALDLRKDAADVNDGTRRSICEEIYSMETAHTSQQAHMGANDASQAECAFSSLNERIDSLEQQCSSLKDERDHLRQELDRVNDQHGSWLSTALSSQFSDYKQTLNERDEWQNECERLQRENKRLHAMIEEQHDRRKQLEEEKALLEDTLRRERQEWQDMQETKNEQLRELQEQLAEVKEEVWTEDANSERDTDEEIELAESYDTLPGDEPFMPLVRERATAYRDDREHEQPRSMTSSSSAACMQQTPNSSQTTCMEEPCAEIKPRRGATHARERANATSQAEEVQKPNGRRIKQLCVLILYACVYTIVSLLLVLPFAHEEMLRRWQRMVLERNGRCMQIPT